MGAGNGPFVPFEKVELWKKHGGATLLDQLLRRHPDWTVPQLAREVGRSLSWVKIWRPRLLSSDPADLNRFSSRSRAHHAPYYRWDSRVEDRIVALREAPPENLHRVPGPKALLYYLPRDPELQELDVALPRSTRTIWNILHKYQLIAQPREVKKQPLPPREPLEEVQMDFKDVSSVPSSQSPQGKRQHVVEVCNFVDAGTSMLLSAQAREDFHAQTAMQAVITFLQEYGCPRMITFDRDPRWVGSSSGRDFPSALRRMLLCLEIQPNVCPPHHPEKNPYVERYHKSYGQECLEVFRPATLRKSVRSRRPSSSITTRKGHIRAALARTSLQESLFHSSRPYHPCQTCIASRKSSSSCLRTPLSSPFFVDSVTCSQALSWSLAKQQTRGRANDKRMIVLRHAKTNLSPQM